MMILNKTQLAKIWGAKSLKKKTGMQNRTISKR